MLHYQFCCKLAQVIDEGMKLSTLGSGSHRSHITKVRIEDLAEASFSTSLVE